MSNCSQNHSLMQNNSQLCHELDCATTLFRANNFRNSLYLLIKASYVEHYTNRGPNTAWEQRNQNTFRKCYTQEEKFFCTMWLSLIHHVPQPIKHFNPLLPCWFPLWYKAKISFCLYFSLRASMTNSINKFLPPPAYSWGKPEGGPH